MQKYFLTGAKYFHHIIIWSQLTSCLPRPEDIPDDPTQNKTVCPSVEDIDSYTSELDSIEYLMRRGIQLSDILSRPGLYLLSSRI